MSKQDGETKYNPHTMPKRRTKKLRASVLLDTMHAARIRHVYKPARSCWELKRAQPSSCWVARAVCRRLYLHASWKVFWLKSFAQSQWRYRAGFTPDFPLPGCLVTERKYSTQLCFVRKDYVLRFAILIDDTLRHPHAITSSTHNATRITRTLAAWIQP